MLRKYTKNKTIFPTDDAIKKLVYLLIDDVVKKSVYLSIVEIFQKWSMPVRDGGTIIGKLLIFAKMFFKEWFNRIVPRFFVIRGFTLHKLNLNYIPPCFYGVKS